MPRYTPGHWTYGELSSSGFCLLRVQKINKTRCPKIENTTLNSAQNFTNSLRSKIYEHQLLRQSRTKKPAKLFSAASFQNLKAKFFNGQNCVLWRRHFRLSGDIKLHNVSSKSSNNPQFANSDFMLAKGTMSFMLHPNKKCPPPHRTLAGAVCVDMLEELLMPIPKADNCNIILTWICLTGGGTHSKIWRSDASDRQILRQRTLIVTNDVTRPLLCTRIMCCVTVIM
jgi:hypothetical protein